MSIADEQFVSCTTFRRSGQGVSTPVWIVALDDGRVAFWTGAHTGKAKRLRNDPRVTLQPCNRTGTVTPGSAVVSGQGEIVTSGPVLDQIRQKVRAKYGFMVHLARVFAFVSNRGRRSDYATAGMVITLDG